MTGSGSCVFFKYTCFKYTQKDTAFVTKIRNTCISEVLALLSIVTGLLVPKKILWIKLQDRIALLFHVFHREIFFVKINVTLHLAKSVSIDRTQLCCKQYDTVRNKRQCEFHRYAMLALFRRCIVIEEDVSLFTNQKASRLSIA